VALGFGREATAWRGLRAWRLTSPRLSATVCLERGAKITSLFDAATGREWLVPAPLRPLRPLTYGALWSAYEMCGWDELLPTRREQAYPGRGPAAGRTLPDHGEVWSMAWDDSSPDEGASVVGSAAGAALPYRVRRRAALDGDGLALVLSYEVVNGDDGAELWFEWAAHPLVARRPDTVVTSGPGWALVADAGGRGSWLRLTWDEAEVPSFSLDEGDAALCEQPAVVPLPSTARVLAPGAAARWTLRATVGP
jgi:hypothetical protein